MRAGTLVGAMRLTAGIVDGRGPGLCLHCSLPRLGGCRCGTEPSRRGGDAVPAMGLLTPLFAATGTRA